MTETPAPAPAPIAGPPARASFASILSHLARLQGLPDEALELEAAELARIDDRLGDLADRDREIALLDGALARA